MKITQRTIACQTKAIHFTTEAKDEERDEPLESNLLKNICEVKSFFSFEENRAAWG